jgi:hypothetical protein
MALHKDINNKIHDDMDGTAIHLLPQGCILINDAEVQVIRAAEKALADQAVLGELNYKALIRRQADDLGNAGQYWEAIKLLKTIGE